MYGFIDIMVKNLDVKKHPKLADLIRTQNVKTQNNNHKVQ